jgi:hypothetical protein
MDGVSHQLFARAARAYDEHVPLASSDGRDVRAQAPSSRGLADDSKWIRLAKREFGIFRRAAVDRAGDLRHEEQRLLAELQRVAVPEIRFRRWDAIVKERTSSNITNEDALSARRVEFELRPRNGSTAYRGDLIRLEEPVLAKHSAVGIARLCRTAAKRDRASEITGRQGQKLADAPWFVARPHENESVNRRVTLLFSR